MPTGYTADVGEGKVTKLRDFALSCARAFGALIEMRDEPSSAPIPDRITTSSYHKKALVDAENRLSELRQMSDEEARTGARKSYDKAIASHRLYEAEKLLKRQRYTDMLKAVRGWRPPTDGHSGLKKFMEEQLTSSIEFDCSGHLPEPVALSSKQWLAEEISKAERDVAYHAEHYAKDVTRANDATEWLRKLRESLA